MLLNFVSSKVLTHQATLEFLEEKLKDALSEEKPLLEKAQTDLFTYTEAIKQLPVRHEFRPPIPMRIRHAVALKKAREQREATDKANEKSIIAATLYNNSAESWNR